MDPLAFLLGIFTTLGSFLIGFLVAWLVCPFLPPLSYFLNKRPLPTSNVRHVAEPLSNQAKSIDDMDELLEQIKKDEMESEWKQFVSEHNDPQARNGWLLI